MDEATKRLVAKALASLFEDQRPNGPCGCMGLECFSVGCEAFWEHIIERPDVLEHAMRLVQTESNLTT